ncbi:glycosyltransferase family 2 protein [Flavobacterium luteum]|uniref:Glycosyltransferase family 2 protein n=1 Tax=Flavobacterium luteum TaxID=2026654 RepID=A0A7J5AKJ2_9FLAO|nr:glycosyltransferase [Flavobacterium luteum]KAB1158023.1 glycosyltransferase family 2 protein [Flavobacterium luteum]
MLSILIPTYNYKILPLVSEIHKQASSAKIEFEIICIDDASPSFVTENEIINSLINSRYEVLDSNIGRSKIRNLLAKKARYDWLLFLDADVLPINKYYISEYIKHIDIEEKVVYGGILYQKEEPEKSKILRWTYGKSREALTCEIRNKNPYLSFLTLNFLIRKSVFEKVAFNETIPNLRHEDTLFSYNLMQKKIKIEHINNPVYHLGLDNFNIAIKKEHEALLALKHLIDHQLIEADYLRISKLMSKIKDFKLLFAISFFFKKAQLSLLKNLSGKSPSLFIYDLYRLGYLCNLENK